MRDVDADVLELGDYLDVLRRHVWLITLTAVIVVAAALVLTLRQDAVYAATTRMVVYLPSTSGPSSSSSVEQLLHGSTDLATQMEIVRSRRVVERALESEEVSLVAPSPRDVAGFIEHHLEVSLAGNTSVMEVVVTADDPEASAALSQAVADAFLTYLQEDAEERSRSAGTELETREETIRGQLRSVQTQLAEEPGSTRASLEEERDDLQAQLRWIATRRVELDSAPALVRRGDIIQPALIPQEPISPKPLRMGVLALILGGMLGVGLAFARNVMDDRLASPADVRRATGASPLAVLDATNDRGGVDEGIRVLRTNLATFLRRRQYGGSSGTVRSTTPTGGVIQVVAVANDTDVAALVDRLSASFEGVGHHVVIVDLDGGSGERLPVPTGTLSLYLSGRMEVADLLTAVGEAPVDWLVAGGGSAGEHVASSRMAALLNELRHRYGVVLVVAPPVTMSAAPLDIGVQSDATVLAVTLNRTRSSELEDAVARLGRVDAPIAGVAAIVGDVAGSISGRFGEPAPTRASLGG